MISKKRHNFTLLELLVAMAVFSVMMAVMMQFFSSAQRATTSTSKRTRSFADARLALEMISRDLHAAYRDPYTPLGTGSVSVSPSISVTHSSAGGSGIAFKSFTQHASFAPLASDAAKKACDGALCYVAYYLEGTDLKIALQESEYGERPAGEPTTETIISDVTSLTFIAVDGDNPYNPNSGKEMKTYNHKLPFAVKIEMTLGSGTTEKKFSKTVPLSSRGQY